MNQRPIWIALGTTRAVFLGAATIGWNIIEGIVPLPPGAAAFHQLGEIL